MTAMGIVSTGTWFPETYVTAEEIAEQSGMPEWVVREKLGIERKYVADPEVHPNDMAVKAARKAIDKAGNRPDGYRRRALHYRGVARVPAVDDGHRPCLPDWRDKGLGHWISTPAAQRR